MIRIENSKLIIEIETNGNPLEYLGMCKAAVLNVIGSADQSILVNNETAILCELLIQMELSAAQVVAITQQFAKSKDLLKLFTLPAA